MLLSDRDLKAAIITILSKVKETLTMNGKTQGKCHYTSVQTYRTFSINMNLNVNYRFWIIGSSVVGKVQIFQIYLLTLTYIVSPIINIPLPE